MNLWYRKLLLQYNQLSKPKIIYNEPVKNLAVMGKHKIGSFHVEMAKWQMQKGG